MNLPIQIIGPGGRQIGMIVYGYRYMDCEWSLNYPYPISFSQYDHKPDYIHTIVEIMLPGASGLYNRKINHFLPLQDITVDYFEANNNKDETWEVVYDRPTSEPGFWKNLWRRIWLIVEGTGP